MWPALLLGGLIVVGVIIVMLPSWNRADDMHRHERMRDVLGGGDDDA